MPHVKQGGITVDAAHELPVAVNAHALQDHANSLDASVQSAQVKRREKFAAIKAEQPSTGALPNLKGLKMANHVHEVFKVKR
jgi:hypothetical protein